MTSRLRAVCVTLCCAGLCCDKPDSSALKGQANSHLTFYGRAVDENGVGLEGAQFEIEIESIPANWTFETRGKPHAFSRVAATSGPDGRFQIDIVGHVLRFKRVERAGYRHFYEMSTGNSNTQGADNTSIVLDAWGDPWYRSDPDHPAVYVFVKDGVNQISVLPTRGGTESGGTEHKFRNEPMWPRKPSLKDVVYVGPATQKTE